MRIGILPHLVCCLASLVLWALAGFQTSTAQDDQESKALANFESKIRPLLEKHCIDCHSGASPKGNLDLSNSNGWKTAQVILPRDPNNSLLMTVITSEDPDVKMPPPPRDPLRNTEVFAIKEWILSGAFDPRFESAVNASSNGPKIRNRVFEITDEDRKFWAFQPISPPSWPPPQSNLTPSAKIDFLVGDLELPTASPRERIRRLFADLWGLPPSFEEVQAFEQDPSPEHWNQIVNGLLDSHHYGERWGRHWLDWVRYAETNGYERDGIKPHAWRYRDYVIEAFAKDKPYNQFIIEQLAGDQWAQSQNFSPENQPEIWREAIIATGFYRLHVWDDEPDDTSAAEFDDADDVMVTIGSAFLGLTIGCARCHDHKFDPISQHDYYSLLSFMRGIDPYGLSKKGGGGRGTGKIQRYLVAESQSIAWEKDRQNQIAEKEKLLIASTDPVQRLMIEGQINALRNLIPPFDAALSVFEIGPTPKPTYVLHRGDPNSPKDLVPSRTPQILNPKIDSPNQLHRLELARWIADERNPMTARVLVNRIWQRHFGVGIVPSIDDFGRTGQLPANLSLLDYLSSELIASGWSIKHLHRIILRSESYNKTSSPRIDSEHSLYAQPQLRRLDAETIRDSILKISGQLNDKRSGPSIYPSLSQEVKESANPVSVSMWQESPIPLQDCRSVYLIVKRSLKVPFLESLDFANSTSPTAIRTVTTTAPQALLLLNDPWMNQKAEQLSNRIQTLAGDELRKQVNHLWQVAYQRRATEEELQRALEYLENNPQRMISLCRAILNSSEFLYVD